MDECTGGKQAGCNAHQPCFNDQSSKFKSKITSIVNVSVSSVEQRQCTTPTRHCPILQIYKKRIGSDDQVDW